MLDWKDIKPSKGDYYSMTNSILSFPTLYLNPNYHFYSSLSILTFFSTKSWKNCITDTEFNCWRKKKIYHNL